MRRRPLALAAAVLTAAGLAVAVAPAAQAAPVYPSGWKIAALSHTAVTVTTARISDKDLTSYRVVASTDKAKLTTSYLNGHAFRSTYSAASRTNTVTVSGMAYTTGTYYYRVGVTYGRYKNYVAWAKTISGGFGLAPNPVTGVTAHGTYLTWSNPGGGSTGAAIDQTSSTGAKVTYTIHNTTPAFTPYGLTKGTRYTYRVRAMNHATHAASSTTSAALTGPAAGSALRVMSYNVLGAYLTGDTEPDGARVSYAGWKDRLPKAAALVAHYRPDVLAVEEGDTILGGDSDSRSHPGNHAYPTSAWSGEWSTTAAAKAVATGRHAACNTLLGRSRTSLPYRGSTHYWPYRQADSLCDYTNVLLKASTYVRAIDGTPDHNGSTNYLVYDRTTTAQLTAAQLGAPSSACWGSDDAADTVPAGVSAASVRCGGFWSLDDGTGHESAYDKAHKPTERSAAWAVLQTAGTRYLLVGAHTSAESAAGWDARRTAQVTNMIALAKRKAAQLHLSHIVYAGDYNNYPGRPSVPDVTTPITRANLLPDSSENAQHNSDTQYMSSNFYSRAPKKQPGGVAGYSNLDHVYVTPGTAVRNFGIGLLLSNGQFVGAIPSDHNPVWADLYLSQ